MRQSILERIAAVPEPCPEKSGTVIEIGPGRGALTSQLLARADRVIAIEIDPVLVQYLRAEFRDEPRLTLVEADVLKADLTQWGTATVAGNLPYYITSPILEKTLAMGEHLKRAVFLVQKEVAERLTARPGSRDYGYLSVQTQLSSTPELLFSVPAGAFRPPPKVDSAVVRLTPKSEPEPAALDREAFLQLCGPVLPSQAENNSQQFVGELRSRVAGCNSGNGETSRAAFHSAVRSNCSNEW